MGDRIRAPALTRELFLRRQSRIGLDPVSPGLSSWRDAIKAPLGAAAVAVQHRLSGYQPPPGAA
jgi:hypothetical protein